MKAINAARMALRGDGTHFVSLDQVIKTMRETGADMTTKYKETARGGLAVNVIECKCVRASNSHTSRGCVTNALAMDELGR